MSRLARRPHALGAAVAALIVLAPPGAALAADGTLRSYVDATRVGVQDQIQYTISVEGGSSLPGQIALPTFTNLRIVGGPATSTQMSFVNGQASQSRSWTYALQPIGQGKATIGPVRAKIGSAEQVAPAIAIEVVAGSVKPPPPRRRTMDPFEQMFGQQRQPVEARLFVEASPSRSSLYVGEPLLLTYYLYTQTGVQDLAFSEAPQFTGFWTEDLERPEQPVGEVVTVEGQAYRRFAVMKKLLYPTRAGKLTIPASTMRIAVPAQGFFDVGSVVERATKPIAVQVKPIPDEEGFGGAVGRFKASASLDRPSVALGEAATFRFKVEGSGNLKWIERSPELTVQGAKVYPPQTKSQLETSQNGITGSRSWEYVLVPETAGDLEVPALTFTYFDPSVGRLTQSVTTPLSLHVGAGAPGAAPPPPQGGAGRSGGPMALRTDLDRASGTSALSGTAVGWLCAATLILHGLLLGGATLGRWRPPGTAATPGPRTARGALRDLERIGRDGTSKEAAAARIEKALHGVFGAQGGDDEKARAVRRILADVHEVRYAPQLGDYSEQLRELAARASEAIRRWA